LDLLPIGPGADEQEDNGAQRGGVSGANGVQDNKSEEEEEIYQALVHARNQEREPLCLENWPAECADEFIEVVALHGLRPENVRLLRQTDSLIDATRIGKPSTGNLVGAPVTKQCQGPK
jgi:hypothetical protein